MNLEKKTKKELLEVINSKNVEIYEYDVKLESAKSSLVDADKKILSLKDAKEKMATLRKKELLECEANIRAIEMLFDIMSSASTHRQKALFVDMSKARTKEMRKDLMYKTGEMRLYWACDDSLPF